MPVLVIGEALVDVIEMAGSLVVRPGGSSANVAVALARLGRPTGLATCFADDEYGRLLAAWLGESGVEIIGDPHVVDRTSVAQARIEADGAAAYSFDVGWDLGPLPELSPSVVHTSSIAAVLPPGCRDVLAVVQRLGRAATVSYDINARPQLTGTGVDVRDRVEAMIRSADVVKASDEDVAALWPEAGVADIAARVLAGRPSVFVVTRGAEGLDWYAEAGSGHVPAVASIVADTIGAGDTVAAGIIDALWERGLLGAARRTELVDAPWDDVLGWAARLAAVTVSRPGADPPWRAELR